MARPVASTEEDGSMARDERRMLRPCQHFAGRIVLQREQLARVQRRRVQIAWQGKGRSAQRVLNDYAATRVGRRSLLASGAANRLPVVL